jgi:hypothetical protein
MSRPSGFVPITYKATGQLLLFLSVLAVVTRAIAGLTGWFVLPPVILWAGMVLFPISIYLIFYAPTQDDHTDEPSQAFDGE